MAKDTEGCGFLFVTQHKVVLRGERVEGCAEILLLGVGEGAWMRHECVQTISNARFGVHRASSPDVPIFVYCDVLLEGCFVFCEPTINHIEVDELPCFGDRFAGLTPAVTFLFFALQDFYDGGCDSANIVWRDSANAPDVITLLEGDSINILEFEGILFYGVFEVLTSVQRGDLGDYGGVFDQGFPEKLTHGEVVSFVMCVVEGVDQ